MTESHGRHEPTREDVIVGRIVDGEATPHDWQELDRLAHEDPDVWRRIAQAQRAHARLERAVEDEIAVAELIELPIEQHSAVYELVTRVRAYGGWAVAAVLTLALLGNFNMPTPSGSMRAGLSLSPDQAYDQYISTGMEEGRVVSEMPALLVDAGEADNGQVLIIRRIMERVRVEETPFYQVKTNEFGERVLSPVEVRQRPSASGPIGF